MSILLCGSEDKTKIVKILVREIPELRNNGFIDLSTMDEIQQREFNNKQMELFEKDGINHIGYADIWAISRLNFFKKPHPDFIAQMMEIENAFRISKAHHFYLPLKTKNSIDISIDLFYNNMSASPILLDYNYKKSVEIILETLRK